MTLGDLERIIRERGILAVNIQFTGSFRVHIRETVEVGFTCAQAHHGSLEAALVEHFRPTSLGRGISDLLD